MYYASMSLKPTERFRCPLDFSSSKFDEEIRKFCCGSIEQILQANLKGCPPSVNATTIMMDHVGFIIGSVSDMSHIDQMQKVLEKLEDWGSPFEFYVVAIAMDEKVP